MNGQGPSTEGPRVPLSNCSAVPASDIVAREVSEQRRETPLGQTTVEVKGFPRIRLRKADIDVSRSAYYNS